MEKIELELLFSIHVRTVRPLGKVDVCLDIPFDVIKINFIYAILGFLVSLE